MPRPSSLAKGTIDALTDVMASLLRKESHLVWSPVEVNPEGLVSWAVHRACYPFGPDESWSNDTYLYVVKIVDTLSSPRMVRLIIIRSDEGETFEIASTSFVGLGPAVRWLATVFTIATE